MSLSDYQKAVLQEMGIPMFELSKQFVSASESSDKSKDKDTADSDAVANVTHTNLPEMALDTQFALDVLNLLNDEVSQQFSWLIDENASCVVLQDHVLCTPPLEKLNVEYKKQIWRVLQQYFVCESWS